MVKLITVILELFSLIIKKFYKKNKQEKLIDYFDKQDEVENVINNVLANTSICRIGVALFHNGSSFYDGTSVQKLSGFCEVTKLNVPSLLTEFQDVPVFQFAHIFKKLITDGMYLATDQDNPSNLKDQNFIDLMKAVGSKSTCYISLVDKKERLIGYMACCKTKDSSPYSKEEIAYIRLMSSQVSSKLFDY